MSEPTSVRPELLAQFASTSRALESHLDARIRAARGAMAAFLAGTDPGLARSNPSIVDSGLSDLSARLEAARRFAELLREAVLGADVHADGGLVTVTGAQLLGALSASARQEFEALLSPAPLPPIDPPTVGTIPQSSGFVDDPVCTATGHFLEDEIDLVVPGRAAALSWPRRYSSRQLDVGGHGPGWWTWAEVACRVGDQSVVLVCPDGRHLTFPLPTAGEPIGADGDDVTLALGADGAATVRWGLRSRSGPETWTFDDAGRLRTIDAALAGRTALEHDPDGRLVGMAHEGGRSLRIEWDGDRIVAVHDGAGRTARYRYSEGHLAAVERDLGGRTYATDVHGRIVEVVDADGVTLARNRYDAEGRVARQVAPTGRVTVFRYEPGRRTAVLDGAGDLIALYVHDHRGRVETMVSPHGAEFTRTFDGDGQIASQLAHDGSGFTSEGSVGPDGVLRIAHHDGRSEELHHDRLGRVVRHEVRGAGTVRYEYEGDSICPSAVTSPSGARSTMSWREGGVLVGVADADGVAFDFEVDGDGLPIEVVDAAGNVARTRRHVTGIPTHLVLPDGAEVTADVDGAGRVTRIVAADGASSTLEYSAAGRLTALVAADGGRTEIRHGHHGFVESVLDPSGRTERVEVDEWGRPVAIGGSETSPGWTLRWSPLGVPTEVTTPGGAHWRQDLDDRHRVAAVTDPVERTTSFGRDDGGRVDRIEAPEGTTVVSRDGAGQIAGIERFPGGSTELRRDDDGALAEVSDADGVRIRTTRTPGGRIRTVQVGDDEPTTFTHDAAGHVSVVSRTGAEWNLEHDWRGSLVGITAPSGRRTSLTRDPLGRPVEIDIAGRVERYGYDGIGRLISWTRPTGATTRLDRDILGRITAVDGPGGTSRFEHDLGAGTTIAHDPLGGRSEIAVDADDRVVRRTDQLGRSTAFDHTPDGRLRAVRHADGSRLGFEHDDDGRITAAFGDGTALARYRYHEGQLAEVEEPGAGRTTSFEATASGRLRSWSDAGGTVHVSRDAAGRVTERRGGAVPDATWEHGPHGRRGTLGGRDVAVDVDQDGTLDAVRLGEQHLRIERDAGSAIARMEIESPRGTTPIEVERDPAGRITQVDSGGTVTRYAYDDADRLASQTVGEDRTQWRYDAAGRLVAEIRTGPAGAVERRFEHDAAHQLVATHGPEGTTRIEHDAAGRRVAEHRPDGSVRRYEWDALSRLTAVVDGDLRVEVDIDCFGRLRRVGGTELAWDLSAPVPELAAVDGEPVLSTGRLVLGVGGDLLASSLVGPAARGGNPWGTAPADGSVSLDCGLPGGIAFAGLIWLGDRVLDPATGRFLTPDPLAAVAGSATQAFPYGYADDDPVNRADPTGRSGQPISIAQFEQMRDEATGPQWGNIALVAGTVAMVGLAFVPGVNVALFVVAGGVVGGIQAGAMQYQDQGTVSLTTVLAGAGIGAATTLVGAHAGRMLNNALSGGLPLAVPAAPTVSSTVREVGANAALSVAIDMPVAATQEYFSARAEGRSFDHGSLRQSALFAGVGGALTTYAPSPTFGDAPSAMTQPIPSLPQGPAPSHLPSSAPAPAPSASTMPTPQLALTAGPTPVAALPAGPTPAALPAGPSPSTSTSNLVVATPSLALPAPEPGFVRLPSGLQIPG